NSDGADVLSATSQAGTAWSRTFCCRPKRPVVSSGDDRDGSPRARGGRGFRGTAAISLILPSRLTMSIYAHIMSIYSYGETPRTWNPPGSPHRPGHGRAIEKWSSHVRKDFPKAQMRQRS